MAKHTTLSSLKYYMYYRHPGSKSSRFFLIFLILRELFIFETPCIISAVNLQPHSITFTRKIMVYFYHASYSIFKMDYSNKIWMRATKFILHFWLGSSRIFWTSHLEIHTVFKTLLWVFTVQTVFVYGLYVSWEMDS